MPMSEIVSVVALTLGVVAVVLGAFVFVVDSMARATFALLGSFLAVAGIMLVLDLHYLALVTALMMTMEMAVMAVFMIMFMMNPAGLMPMTMVHNARGSAVAGASELGSRARTRAQARIRGRVFAGIPTP